MADGMDRRLINVLNLKALENFVDHAEILAYADWKRLRTLYYILNYTTLYPFSSALFDFREVNELERPLTARRGQPPKYFKNGLQKQQGVWPSSS